MQLPEATVGAGISHHVTSGFGGKEDMLDAIWLVSITAAVSVSLVAAFVVF